MKKILITGSNGLLGQKLVYKLKDRSGMLCIATARGANRLVQSGGYEFASLDITDKDDVSEVFSRFLPDVVINTAAMTNVDACETDRENCWLLNVTAVQNQVSVLETLKRANP